MLFSQLRAMRKRTIRKATKRKPTIRKRTLPSVALTVAVVIGWALASASIAAQDLPSRPDTRQLLPETTVALLKIRDFRQFVEKMKNSSGGQMLQSESIQPLVDSLYENAAAQYEKVSDDVGLTLEEIQSLPAGEITLAVIAPRRKDLAFVVMMETDPENEAVDKALQRGRSLFDEEPEVEASEFDIEIEKAIVSGQPAYFCKHDGLFIGSSSKQELEDIFTRWSGQSVKKVRPLAENRKFVTIAKRCAVSDDALPDSRFFIDPIGIFKSAARGDAGMQFAVALLPTLGLDGLLAAGGNMYIDHEDYESISHLHVLLASPKEGVLNALALKPDSYAPQPWVPVEIGQYVTTSWDVPQMMASIKEISDKIVDGQYEAFFKNIQDECERRGMDVDPQTDFIDHLSGRLTFVRPILSGAEINGIGNVVSFGVNDPESIKETLGKFLAIEEFENLWVEKEYESIKFWVRSEEAIEDADRRRNNRKEFRQKRAKERAERRGEVYVEKPNLLSKSMRQPSPAFGFIGENLIVSDSEEFFEMAIDAFNGDRLTLANDDTFLEHSETMAKLLKNDLPAAVFYFDSVREIEFYLKALNQDSLMELLEYQSQQDQSGFLSGVKASFDEHGMPAMEAVKDYLSVSGGCITTDESGYHLLLFQERPEAK